MILLLLCLQADPAPLVEQLRSEDPEKRLEAETRLIELGAPARKAVEELRRSGESELRLRAERILQYLDWGITFGQRKTIDATLAKSKIPPDRDALEWPKHWEFPGDEEEWKRLGPSATRYLLHLRDASKDPQRRRKLLNVASLTGGKEASPAAFGALRSRDPADRWCGVTACLQIGDPSAVGPLVELLRDEEVVQVIRRGPSLTVGTEAADAIEVLTGLPLDPEVWLRDRFPFRSQHQASAHPERIEAWWGAAKHDPSPEAWREAARKKAVRSVGAERPAQERLEGCLVLLAVGGEDARLCDTIIDLCRPEPRDAEAYRFRMKALHFLLASAPGARFAGRPAERIEEGLEAILDDPARKSGWTTALGLAWELYTEDNTNLIPPGKLHPLDRLRRRLPGFLHSEDPLQRFLAAMTLAFMGERGVEAPILEALRRALEPGAIESGWLRSAALWMTSRWEAVDFFDHMLIAAVEKLRPEGALELLRVYLREASPPRRSAAVRGLAALGDAEAALPVIREFLALEKDPVWKGHTFSADAIRESAFRDLYRLRRAEALEWVRKELSTTRQRPFLSWSLASFLVEQGDPLGIEYWAGQKGKVQSGVYGRILKMEPEVLVPTLLDLVEKGSKGAREFLVEWAGDPSFATKSAAELRSWWTAFKDTLPDR